MSSYMKARALGQPLCIRHFIFLVWQKLALRKWTVSREVEKHLQNSTIVCSVRDKQVPLMLLLWNVTYCTDTRWLESFPSFNQMLKEFVSPQMFLFALLLFSPSSFLQQGSPLDSTSKMHPCTLPITSTTRTHSVLYYDFFFDITMTFFYDSSVCLISKATWMPTPPKCIRLVFAHGLVVYSIPQISGYLPSSWWECCFQNESEQ